MENMQVYAKKGLDNAYRLLMRLEGLGLMRRYGFWGKVWA